MKRALFFLTIVATYISSCKTGDAKPASSADNSTQVDSLPGQCPYLAKDNKDNVVISWVRAKNDTSNIFCYSVSNDEGKTFNAAIEIPTSTNIEPHSENLPKIIYKPSGEIMALWGAANPNPKNKYSGLVYYSKSFDDGKTWSAASPLVNDQNSFDQRYYDVARLQNGEIGIIWLDNRKTTNKDGSALYFASTNGREGFTPGKLISQPCCQCCRTDLFVDTHGQVHVLYRGIIQDSIRDMVHIVSIDGGRNFSQPERISKDNWVLNACPHTGPSMTENKEGIHFAWFTGGKNKGCFYNRSTDNGVSFSTPENISAMGSHPQMATQADGNLIITWDETLKTDTSINKRIGIEKRNQQGKYLSKKFITPDSGSSGYPVVTTLDGNKCLVAYTSKKGKNTFVNYQVIEL
jgi:hypothetical protein